MIAFYNTNVDVHVKLDNVPRYQFCCPQCIFRLCWNPGIRNTETIGIIGEPTYGRRLLFDTQEIYVCTWMVDYGCPDEPEEDHGLGIERFQDGWQSSPI